MAVSDRSTKESAYKQIQDMILQMEIGPGEVITELAISEKLGIGRTPVREALKRLEQEGLVITRNRRKRVYLLTVNELNEIFEIKIRLETFVAREAARHCTKADAEELRKWMRRLKTAAHLQTTNQEEERRRSLAWLKADKSLHHKLFSMAGNTKVEQIIRNLDLQWQRLRLGIYTLEGRMERSYEEHRKFVDAIIENDPDTAGKEMKIHLTTVADELVKLFRLFNYPLKAE